VANRPNGAKIRLLLCLGLPEMEAVLAGRKNRPNKRLRHKGKNKGETIFTVHPQTCFFVPKIYFFPLWLLDLAHVFLTLFVQGYSAL
jgi:hypothetical protein